MIHPPLVRRLSAGRQMIPPLVGCKSVGKQIINHLVSTPPREGMVPGGGEGFI